jgi:hypothetical protein
MMVAFSVSLQSVLLIITLKLVQHILRWAFIPFVALLLIFVSYWNSGYAECEQCRQKVELKKVPAPPVDSPSTTRRATSTPPKLERKKFSSAALRFTALLLRGIEVKHNDEIYVLHTDPQFLKLRLSNYTKTTSMWAVGTQKLKDCVALQDVGILLVPADSLEPIDFHVCSRRARDGVLKLLRELFIPPNDASVIRGQGFGSDALLPHCRLRKALRRDRGQWQP